MCTNLKQTLFESQIYGDGPCHQARQDLKEISINSRERLRRVLRKKAAVIIHLQIYIFTPSHLQIYIVTPSHLQIYIFSPSHLQIYIVTPSDLQIYIFTLSHLQIYIVTPSHLQICIFSPSHLQIYTFTPSAEGYRPSKPLLGSASRTSSLTH